MEYRPLGNTGVSVSGIGFGTSQFRSGGVYPDDATCVYLLRHAFDTGVNLYDLSLYHGNGQVEELIRKAFRFDRHNIIISGKIYAGASLDLWSEKQMLASVKQSLQKLGTDYFDLLSLHLPPLKLLKSGDVFRFMHGLKEQGLARFIGVSLEAQPTEARIALEQGFDILQVRYNLLFPEVQSIFPVIAEKGVGLIVNSPLEHGYLGGRYKTYADVEVAGCLQEASRIRRRRYLVEEMLRKAHAFTDLCSDKAPTLPNLAIKFVLTHDVVSTTIPGPRNKAELVDNLSVADGSYLSDEELARAGCIHQQGYSTRPDRSGSSALNRGAVKQPISSSKSGEFRRLMIDKKAVFDPNRPDHG